MDASYLLFVFLRRTPMILLLLGGIVFALVRWSRHPRVSLLTILGLGFYLLETAFFTFLIYFMPDLLRGGSISMSDAVYTILYVIDDIAYAAVLLALVAAAFTGRAGSPSENQPNIMAKAA